VGHSLSVAASPAWRSVSTNVVEDGEAVSLLSVCTSNHWFAAYTFPRHEKKVSLFLDQLQVKSFCPVYTTVHYWKQRKAEVQLPLFPGYVFVNISEKERISVLSVPGVVHLVGSKGKPSPLPADQIEALRTSLRSRAASPHPFLSPGQTVRISSGPLSGLEGVVLRRKGQMRIVVSLATIGQSIVLELEESDLNPIAAPVRPPGSLVHRVS
jgi:transcription antitermination factor NusG